MGLIKALAGAVGGGLADQWLEVMEPDSMEDTTIFVPGVKVRKDDKRSSNKKGTENVVTDGSIIHVYDGQIMFMVDGGKVVDFTAEPGYYKVTNDTAPSMFSGKFGDSIKEAFARIKYGGTPPASQHVFYLNTQEIKGIRFGTVNPVNYFDSFYNAELHLRAHGTYSIRISDPMKFYIEVIPRSAVTENRSVDINDVNSQYLSEFLEAFQSAINQMSADGERISFVTSKSRELGKYMSNILDEDWNQTRGMMIEAVGIASITYDDESKNLINLRNKGAMLSDQQIQQGYMAGSVGAGIENAGKNEAGAMTGFMGVGLGMNAGGNIMSGYHQQNTQNQQQGRQQQNGNVNTWKCEKCGAESNGKFCSECGSPKPDKSSWKCPKCSSENTGKFCAECGTAKPQAKKCPKCGAESDGKFCAECGSPISE